MVSLYVGSGKKFGFYLSLDFLRHSRSMHLYRNGMPLPLLAEFLGHAQMETTIAYYANADVTMKKEAISKAIKDMDLIFNNKPDIAWRDDEEMLKKLYGLL